MTTDAGSITGLAVTPTRGYEILFLGISWSYHLGTVASTGTTFASNVSRAYMLPATQNGTAGTGIICFAADGSVIKHTFSSAQSYPYSFTPSNGGGCIVRELSPITRKT